MSKTESFDLIHWKCHTADDPLQAKVLTVQFPPASSTSPCQQLESAPGAVVDTVSEKPITIRLLKPCISTMSFASDIEAETSMPNSRGIRTDAADHPFVFE